MKSELRHFLQSWLINTLAVLVAVYLVPGIHFKDHSLWTPFVASLVLGILNAFIRPLVMLLALPLLIFTLGFFMLVINATMLYVVSLLLGGYFEVDGFWSAVFGAVIIGAISLFLNLLSGNSASRIRIHRHRSSSGGAGDDGPVIDI